MRPGAPLAALTLELALDELPVEVEEGEPARLEPTRDGVREQAAQRVRRDRAPAEPREDVVDELRDEGVRIGALGIKCFRPYPLEEVREAIRHAERIVVVEKAFAVGAGGIVSQNVRLALSGLDPIVYDVVAGLGGRPITKQSLHTLLDDVLNDRLEPGRLTFLDIDWNLVERELQRTHEKRRSGPHAENILRDIGVVAAGPT